MVGTTANQAKMLGNELKSLTFTNNRLMKSLITSARALTYDFDWKNVLLPDDMIDTAGTLTQSVDSLLKNGAKRVFAVATHPVFSEPAITRLSESPIEKVWVTDTIALTPQAIASKKFEVVSLAPTVAEAITRINNYNSVSELFK